MKEYLDNPINWVKNAVDTIHNKRYADIRNPKECVDCHEVKDLISFSRYGRKGRKKDKIMSICKRCQHIRYKKNYTTKEQKVALEIIKLIQDEHGAGPMVELINNKYFPI